jgi:hypothetical protein
MIYATTDQIRTAIASDAVLLATLRDFFDSICGDLDADISMLLDELPGAISKNSPFLDEAALADVVRREMLAALFGLSLRVLTPRGSA